MTLLPPNPGCIAIARYVPDPDKGQPPEDDYPSFCPWVISENVIVAPLALGPGWTGPFGIGEFRLDGPEGGQLGFHSQHRMPPP